MGGGNSTVVSNSIRTSATAEPFHTQKSVFEINHQKFMDKFINAEMTQDLQRYEDIKSNNIDQLKGFIKKYKGKARREGITNTVVFRDLLLQVLGENLIKKYLEVPKYDIFKVINAEYAKLGFGDEQYKAWKAAEILFQKEFEMNLKTMVFSFKNGMNDLSKMQIIGMNSDMKYHPDYQPKILTVIISKQLLEKKEIALDLANMIEKSTTLQIVIIMLYPTDINGNVLDSFGFDPSDYNIVFHLVNGVAKNRKIKAFFLHSIKDYKIVIAPEISNLIINKLQSETLLAFHLGGFTYSRDFMKKLLFQIISTRSMLFLSLHSNKLPELLNELLLPAIMKNSSLVALALTGFTNESKSIGDEFKLKIERKTKQINVMYLGEKSIVTYPFTI